MAKDFDANPLYSREESPFTSALLDFWEDTAHQNRIAAPQLPRTTGYANAPPVVIEKDAHPELRLIMATVLAVAVSPAVAGIYFALSAANALVAAMEPAGPQNSGRMVLDAKQYLNDPALPHKEQQENKRSMTIEGKDAENIQRTLEGASRYGATHVAFQLAGADKSLQGESIIFFQNNRDALYYVKGRELAAGERMILAPVDNLNLELKKQLESHKGNNLNGQPLPDITIQLENVYERSMRHQEAAPERISKEPTSLKELMEKTQHAAIVKDSVPDYDKTSILVGRISKEEIPAIQQALQVEKDSGNRFVTFPIKEALQATDFKAHRSALAALEHQYDTSIGNERHEVRSIVVVEKDLEKLLEHKKEQGQDIKMENQREDKRSRGSELSM